MLCAMRTRLLLAAALTAASICCVFLYLFWVSPEVNRPLGLDRFDESRVREKVLITARGLLDNPGTLDVRISQELDKANLRRMQELFGFQATSYWVQREVPIMKWSYQVYRPRPLAKWSILKSSPWDLEAKVSSQGQILALTIPPRRELSPLKLTPEEAKSTAEDALRTVGVDVGQLTLTSRNEGESEGGQRFEFYWKQPVKGLPGLYYSYSVQLQSGYLTSFKTEILFSEEEPPHPWRDLVFQLLFGATWFFLLLVLLFLFIQKLRRDEVDFQHAQKVGFVAGGLTFIRFLANPAGGVFETILYAALGAVLTALFIAGLWSVAESFLRQTMGDKLRFVDILFQGRVNVRELARHLLWASGCAALLLGVSAFLLEIASASRSLSISLLPLNFTLYNMRYPGSLVGNAVLGPLFASVLLGTVFLGVIYPVLRLRFRARVAAPVFALIFALALAWIVQETMLGPVGLAFAISFLSGLLLFAVMEKSGLLASLFFLYVPPVLWNVSLLLTGTHAPFKSQALLALGIVVALFALLAIFATIGKPLASVENYEPEYLIRMRERERFARELEIAKGVQERFLPKETPVIPGFSLATRCVPAMEVGGDYYDFLALPGGKWLLLIGDISGKGVRAAFYMTLTKGILHAISSFEGDHTGILRRLNRIFGALSEPGIFLTLCAVVLEPETGEVQLLSAGHNPPFLVRRNSVQVLQPKGLVLGLMNDEFFMKSLKDVHMKLEPGDTLVLYTDGVTEAMDKDCQEYGMERLQESLERAEGMSAQDLLETVVEDVVRFQHGGPQADDMTLLVLKTDEA